MRESRILKTVEIYTEMPKEWDFMKGALTAPRGYEWICNKKSRFGGEYKQGLLKVDE